MRKSNGWGRGVSQRRGWNPQPLRRWAGRVDADGKAVIRRAARPDDVACLGFDAPKKVAMLAVEIAVQRHAALLRDDAGVAVSQPFPSVGSGRWPYCSNLSRGRVAFAAATGFSSRNGDRNGNQARRHVFLQLQHKGPRPGSGSSVARVGAHLRTRRRRRPRSCSVAARGTGRGLRQSRVGAAAQLAIAGLAEGGLVNSGGLGECARSRICAATAAVGPGGEPHATVLGVVDLGQVLQDALAGLSRWTTIAQNTAARQAHRAVAEPQGRVGQFQLEGVVEHSAVEPRCRRRGRLAASSAVVRADNGTRGKPPRRRATASHELVQQARATGGGRLPAAAMRCAGERAPPGSRANLAATRSSRLHRVGACRNNCSRRTGSLMSSTTMIGPPAVAIACTMLLLIVTVSTVPPSRVRIGGDASVQGPYRARPRSTTASAPSGRRRRRPRTATRVATRARSAGGRRRPDRACSNSG